MANYSFDTSALIAGWHALYPPDVFPSLWEKLAVLIAEGRVCAIEEVKGEIERIDDDLKVWCKSQKNLFLKIDGPIQTCVTSILSTYPRLLNPDTGASAADAWVIALAETNGLVVVTQEQKKNLNKPRIPDVCEGRNVSCMNFLDFIRAEGWQFS